MKRNSELKRQIGIMVVSVLVLFIAPVLGFALKPPDFEVSDPQFAYDVNARFRPSTQLFAKDNITDSKGTTNWIVQERSALFHNTGTKTVESVTWEYILYRDAAKTDLARVYTIRNRTKILPGESLRLKKAVYSMTTSPYKNARIVRIEYADGTIWKGTKTSK